MRAWWRGNRWYLVALVALIPAAIVVSLIPRWFPYQASLPQYDEVALGETVRYSGADITLDELEVLDGREWDAPEGSDLVVATLDILVDDPVESTLCELSVVDLAADPVQRWRSAIGEQGDYRIPDRFEQRCDLLTEGRYDLQIVFVVPAGQITEPVIELTSSAALPRALRLS